MRQRRRAALICAAAAVVLAGCTATDDNGSPPHPGHHVCRFGIVAHRVARDRGAALVDRLDHDRPLRHRRATGRSRS